MLENSKNSLEQFTGRFTALFKGQIAMQWIRQLHLLAGDLFSW